MHNAKWCNRRLVQYQNLRMRNQGTMEVAAVYSFELVSIVKRALRRHGIFSQDYFTSKVGLMMLVSLNQSPHTTNGGPLALMFAKRSFMIKITLRNVNTC